MADCISKSFKDMILNQLAAKKPYELLSMFVQEFMPVCEEVGPVTPTKAAIVTAEKAKKSMASPWPRAVFIDATGNRHDEGLSASALYEQLTGKKPSGSICNEEGNKCTPATLIDSFRFFGYHVQGNGEPAPTTDPDDSITQTVRKVETWKEHLKNSGKKFVVVHPEYIKKQTGD